MIPWRAISTFESIFKQSFVRVPDHLLFILDDFTGLCRLPILSFESSHRPQRLLFVICCVVLPACRAHHLFPCGGVAAPHPGSICWQLPAVVTTVERSLLITPGTLASLDKWRDTYDPHSWVSSPTSCHKLPHSHSLCSVTESNVLSPSHGLHMLIAQNRGKNSNGKQ